MNLEELKEKAAYHYKCLHECMDEIYEIDEDEGQRLWEWFEEMGTAIEVRQFPQEDNNAD
jgi:hypothetical protein